MLIFIWDIKKYILQEKICEALSFCDYRTALIGEPQLAEKKIMQSVIFANPILLIIWILAYFVGVLAVRQNKFSVIFAFITGALVMIAVTLCLMYGCELLELATALLGLFVLLMLTREVPK